MTNPMQFPDGFVFGGATAAYQVEGETRTHGKGKVPWDDFLAAQGRFSPDPASDFYNKYPVDIDLCQRFGINGIRVSIAWSRIFPSGTGEINPEGVAFYHELFATCNKAGVIPYVTLDHFDTPEAFYQNGGEGFLTRTTIDAFVEYAKFCFAEFTEVKHWFTFNEIPATAEGSFIVGNWPHGEKYRLDKAFQLMHNMMVAHAKAVVAFHEGGFEGEIGIVQNLEPKYPLDPNNAADCEAARMADVINNRWVLDATFRGHYAADTMEAATKLAHIAGGELDVRDEDIAALEKEIAALEEKLGQKADALTKLRTAAAQDLSSAIEEQLFALGMPKARFHIRVEQAEDYGANGRDDVAMFFSANPGEEEKPLQKVASGGELSRIALAIKTVASSRDSSVPSMVFDEIDTGIGGRTAQMVAERIALVAQYKQVLCITHLPQIACMADAHLYISKRTVEGTTATQIRPLSERERISEIARMASGADMTTASLDNAREMVSHAKMKKDAFKRDVLS